MKVIFLDIDGVLVNQESLMNGGGLNVRAHPDCVAALNTIVATTNAVLVLSSTWRFLGIGTMRCRLQEWGVAGRLVDCTPVLDKQVNGIYVGSTRGDEIHAWLDHNKPEKFVILDDDSDMGKLAIHLVQTRFETGLTMSDADKAIEKLRREANTCP